MKKIFLLLALCLIAMKSFSIVTPIPIVMDNHIGSSTADIIRLTIVWISLNILSILYVVIKSIIWIIKKNKKETYYEYVWYSKSNKLLPDINTEFLMIVNGFALIVILYFWIFGTF